MFSWAKQLKHKQLKQTFFEDDFELQLPDNSSFLDESESSYDESDWKKKEDQKKLIKRKENSNTFNSNRESIIDPMLENTSEIQHYNQSLLNSYQLLKNLYEIGDGNENLIVKESIGPICENNAAYYANICEKVRSLKIKIEKPARRVGIDIKNDSSNKEEKETYTKILQSLTNIAGLIATRLRKLPEDIFSERDSLNELADNWVKFSKPIIVEEKELPAQIPEKLIADTVDYFFKQGAIVITFYNDLNDWKAHLNAAYDYLYPGRLIPMEVRSYHLKFTAYKKSLEKLLKKINENIPISIQELKDLQKSREDVKNALSDSDETLKITILEELTSVERDITKLEKLYQFYAKPLKNNAKNKEHRALQIIFTELTSAKTALEQKNAPLSSSILAYHQVRKSKLLIEEKFEEAIEEFRKGLLDDIDKILQKNVGKGQERNVIEGIKQEINTFFAQDNSAITNNPFEKVHFLSKKRSELNQTLSLKILREKRFAWNIQSNTRPQPGMAGDKYQFPPAPLPSNENNQQYSTSTSYASASEFAEGFVPVLTLVVNGVKLPNKVTVFNTAAACEYLYRQGLTIEEIETTLNELPLSSSTEPNDICLAMKRAPKQEGFLFDVGVISLYRTLHKFSERSFREHKFITQPTQYPGKTIGKSLIELAIEQAKNPPLHPLKKQLENLDKLLFHAFSASPDSSMAPIIYGHWAAVAQINSQQAQHNQATMQYYHEVTRHLFIEKTDNLSSYTPSDFFFELPEEIMQFGVNADSTPQHLPAAAVSSSSSLPPNAAPNPKNLKMLIVE